MKLHEIFMGGGSAPERTREFCYAARHPLSQLLRRRRKKPSCLMSNGQDCNSENAILILCPARNKSSICMRMRFQLIKI